MQSRRRSQAVKSEAVLIPSDRPPFFFPFLVDWGSPYDGEACSKVSSMRLGAKIYRMAWLRSLDDPCPGLALAACTPTSMTSEFLVLVAASSALQSSSVPAQSRLPGPVFQSSWDPIHCSELAGTQKI